MKRQDLILLTVVFAFVLSTVSFPQSSLKSEHSENYRLIEDNYLKGLNTDKQGLSISCAYYPGELKSRQVLISWMKMMTTEEPEGARVIAAWYLIKIGDPWGLYRVKREAELSSCFSVQCKCEFFYKQYLNIQESEVA